MDNRAIGFFDSGLGGLTCITHMMKALPEEKIIYFGDTARTPYGSKAPSTIRNFSMQIAEFLMQHDVKMIVIACNTVTSICLEELRLRYPNTPIMGVISPAAEKVATSCSTKSKVGIIGTKVTIKSKQYEKLINQLNGGIDTYAIPCPAFVPLIEEGIIKNDIMDMTIRYYLDDFVLAERLDTLVLGCTHYPLIRSNIERLYPNLTIIDPSEETAFKIKEVLQKKDMLAQSSPAENIFYASDLSENFINMIDRIFSNSDVNIKFKNLDIESVGGEI